MAGNGPSYPSSGFYFGDGGAVTNAYIYSPRGIAIDQAGNLLIADSGNNRVRAVDVNGIIRTVAGLSGAGFSGDGGAPTNATLYDPEGISLDPAGNVLIADTLNGRIRKVFLYASFKTLALRNLGVQDEGNYSLVVSSPFGSVTSAVIAVTVVLPPTNFTAQAGAGGLRVQLAGTPNYPYILQMATNLTAPVGWQSIVTSPADASGYWSWTITSLLGNPACYYRAMVGQ